MGPYPIQCFFRCSDGGVDSWLEGGRGRRPSLGVYVECSGGYLPPVEGKGWKTTSLQADFFVGGCRGYPLVIFNFQQVQWQTYTLNS